jgi:ClpP class serine protease
MSSEHVTAFRPMLMHKGFAQNFIRAHRLLDSPAAYGMHAFSGERSEEYRPYGYRDGIAVIAVRGALYDRISWWGGDWCTGYNVLRWQLAEAHEDADVRGIVLDIDSYGGMVAGCFDLCDFAVEAKAASGKPVAAILSETAYSAGYAIAATADSIAVPRTGGVGSIGTVTTHWNIAGLLEKYGEEVTILTAGDHKADGNSYGPLPDDVRARILAELEDLRQLFAASVVRYRAGATVAPTLDQVLATEARTYDGPAQLGEALKLGLFDAIASPADAFAAFADFVNAA